MKLTNNHNLPEPLVRAIQAFEKDYRDSYGTYGSNNQSDYSVTDLLTPPQLLHLKREHDDELSEDVLDRIYALLGHSVHHILELAEDQFDTNTMAEVRFYGEVLGVNISGKIDRYEKIAKRLEDWKVCSVWEHVNGLKPEREQQLNILAWLMRENGYEVDELQINSLYRDWSINQAKSNGDYPQTQFSTHTVKCWDNEDVLRFIEGRVRLHEKEHPRDCTLDEQWAKPTQYAVMKKGNKRASKLHSSLADAQAHAADLGNASVEMRLGEKTRCEKYCLVRDVCPQYAKETGVNHEQSTD